jgi:hypothetical protein
MTTRRNCLQSLGGILTAGMIGRVAKAGVQCGQPSPPYGVQSCVAGIPQEKLNMVFAVQQASEWCWAACIQMVFAYWGHPVPQQEIVRQTWGQVSNMPGQPSDILRDLNRAWTDANGNDFRVSGDVFSASAITAAQDLQQEMPLIIGSLGHAMVLSAVSYNRAPNGQIQLSGALVRDPYPGRGRRQLTPMEIAASMLLVRIRFS